MNHTDKHDGEKPFKCDYCDFRTSYLKNMRLHKESHPPETRRTHICRLCDKKFRTRGTLEKHELSHKAKPFACRYCPKKFVRKIRYIDHCKIHENDPGHISCHHCKKKFFRFWTLDRHLKIHTGENVFACNFCPEKFPHKVGLNIHLRIHSGPYSCNLCGKSWKVEWSLNKHMQNAHMKAKSTETVD